ncbi:hypothetical protein CCHR01_11997 [Colletotrichum chrysophilum]|uniref:Heterokaryon incompatibility domain-containing protein n=1 Tax=Colletotrichum chrysophilum TaxID=1836956 RepID=A0AAD9AEA7_9PEZI|nr:hypothetical protein CCHR01_11997 [Colletotrichum chrysophilum]
MPARVTSSLRDALKALRHPSQTVTVWVDALSIDQSNNHELSQQVQLMDIIYWNAANVVVWLGPSSGDSSLAITTLRRVGAEAASFESGSELDTFAKCVSSAELAAIVDLFERPYRNRLWVVQEIFYASEIMLRCGSDLIEWTEITPAMALFNKSEWKRMVNEAHPPGGTLNRILEVTILSLKS